MAHHAIMLSTAHPQPFQGEPRGESPPARCPKPTRRNAGLATGQEKCKDNFAGGCNVQRGVPGFPGNPWARGFRRLNFTVTRSSGPCVRHSNLQIAPTAIPRPRHGLEARVTTLVAAPRKNGHAPCRGGRGSPVIPDRGRRSMRLSGTPGCPTFEFIRGVREVEKLIRSSDLVRREPWVLGTNLNPSP